MDDLYRFNEAIVQYDKAVEINPNFAEAYNNRGISFNNLNRFEDAIMSFDKALDLDREHMLASQNKEFSLQKLEKFQKSIQSYDNAIKNNPDNAENYFKKAWLLFKIKKLEDAISMFDKAIEIDPAKRDLFNSLKINGEVLYSDVKRIEKDRTLMFDFRKPIKSNINVARTYVKQGIQLYKERKYEESIESIDRAIEIDSRNASAYANKAIALTKLKRYNESLTNFDKSIDLDKYNSYFYNNKGITLFEMNRFDESIQFFDKKRLFWMQNIRDKIGNNVLKYSPRFKSLYYPTVHVKMLICFALKNRYMSFFRLLG